MQLEAESRPAAPALQGRSKQEKMGAQHDPPRGLAREAEHGQAERLPLRLCRGRVNILGQGAVVRQTVSAPDALCQKTHLHVQAGSQDSTEIAICLLADSSGIISLRHIDLQCTVSCKHCTGCFEGAPEGRPALPGAL